MRVNLHGFVIIEVASSVPAHCLQIVHATSDKEDAES